MADDGEVGDWLSDYVLHFLKSPTWVMPIAQFVDERCIIFDTKIEDENKLEYTICHNEFKQLIDNLLAAHLLELSVTPETFQHFCQNGLEKNPTLHRVLVEQLLSIDDFLTFKAMMTKRNADLFREALRTIEQGGDLAEQVAASAAAAAVPDEPVTVEPMDGDEDHDEVAAGMVAEEWRFYEDQLFMAMTSSEEEHERAQAERWCEEAELEQAIALSLQLEEERLRLVAEAETAAAAAKEAEAAAPEAAPPVPPPQEVPAAPDAPVKAPKTLPRVVRVEPLKNPPRANLPPLTGAPQAPPAVTSGDFEKRRAQAILEREKQKAPAAQAPPAAAPPAAAPPAEPPSEEEKKQRAEHLRKQRELLVQKRNQERQKKMEQFQAGGGNARARAAFDAARAGAPEQAAEVGKKLAEQLAGGGDIPKAPADTVAQAEQMRQALTRQLKQTLAGM